MKLDQLDYAVMQRNHRQKAIDLRRAVAGNSMALYFWENGEKLDPSSIFDVTPIRIAVLSECDKFIAEKDAELAALGIEP